MSSWMKKTTCGTVRLGGDSSSGSGMMIELPIMTCTPSPLNVIIGHGLGSHPKEKNHWNDITYNLWMDAMKYLPVPSIAATAVENEQDDDSCRHDDKKAVFYTARGHGQSSGWEHCAASDFTWPILAEDMLAVAHRTMERNATVLFTAFGQSMGAASALYLAMAHPHCIQALILARPPRAWEMRRRVTNDMIASAREMEQRLLLASTPVSGSATASLPWHLPILGAALTDLPPKEDNKESSAYAKITCPVLILCHGQDEAHPMETGLALHDLIPQSSLHSAASNEDEARRDWPKIIADWLLVQEGIVFASPPQEERGALLCLQ